MTQTIRRVISEGELMIPKNCEVHKGGWYYLGASSEPQLIKVTAVGNAHFTYIAYRELETLESAEHIIETWIGQHLIATASTRKRASIELYLRDPKDSWMNDWADHVAFILDHADLREADKLELEQMQALNEYCQRFPGAEDRFRMRGYHLEAALRELDGIYPSAEAVIAHYSELYSL